jgi:hypothetical protein
MAPRNSLADVPIFFAHPSRCFRTDFSNVRDKVQTIAGLAVWPEQIERVRSIGAAILGRGELPERLERAHRWRASHVDFEPEQEQILQSPDHVLERRIGDCTGHAVLGAALALLAGADVAFVTMGGEEHDPEHLSLMVATPGSARAAPPFWLDWSDHRAIPGWTWSDSSTPGGIELPRALSFGQRPGSARIERWRRPFSTSQ